MIMYNYLLLFILLMAWSFSVLATSVGYYAPPFTLLDTYKEPISLSDFRGKYIVLEWFNPDCRTVQQHRQTLRELANRYRWQGVIWLGINSTHYMTQEDNLMWKETNRLSYRLLSDFSGEVARRYQVKITPHIYIINPLGIVIYSGAINDDPCGDKITPVNYIEMALKEATTNKPLTYSQTQPYGCLLKYKY